MPSQKYLKIAGVLVNYSDAHPVNLGWSTSAPSESDFVILLPYTATLPVMGSVVQWYRRDNTLLWAGVISEVDWDSRYEGATQLQVKIIAVGYNDRLYHRTTWNRATFRCASYRSYAATVHTADVSGTGTVYWDSGDVFSKDLVGKTVLVNGVPKVIAAVASPFLLTLTTAIGTHTAYSFAYTVYCGDVVKDLLTNYADSEGFTYAGGGIANGVALDNKGVTFDPPISIMAAINSLLELNSTFYFASDELQECSFQPRNTVAAPADFTVLSGKQKRAISLRTTREDVRNVEISTTTWDAVQPRTFSVTASGTDSGWFVTTYKIASIVSIKVNGVDFTFTDTNAVAPTEDFIFQLNDSGFWQNPASVMLGSGDVIDLEYKAVADNLIEYVDATAVAARAAAEGSGLGRYEMVIDRTALSGKTEALAKATSSVARQKDDLGYIQLNTFELGYKVGQIVVLTIPKVKLTAVTMFIDAIKATDSATKGNYDFEYTLDLISVSRRLTDDDVLRNVFGGIPKQSIGSAGGSGVVAGGSVPSGLTYTPALFEYGRLAIENVAVATPNGVTGLAIYPVYVDELTNDMFVTTNVSANATTDPLTIACTGNPNRVTPLTTLAFAVGDFVVWNDPGQYEMGQITAITGTWPNLTLTIQRHYPGATTGTSTFEAPMTTHASGTGLFVAQYRKFQLSAVAGAFGGLPDTFDMNLPAACVLAITASPFNDTGFGPFVNVNLAAATLPGLRTCTGDSVSFQLPGAMTAAAGVNKAQSFSLPSDHVYRVGSAYLETAPTGASFKTNIRYSTDNGATWVLLEQQVITATNKISWSATPTDPPGNRRAPYTGAWPFPILRQDYRVNISVEQVGSTIAGSDLTVKLDT